jgi:predicted DNA-binding transcriptional regulator YafY
MNRFERALGIVLLLRSGRTLSSKELASRFEVSVRTIYRDIETLAALGVPIYAEQGRGGGFRLVEGYLLPPIMFSLGEATSLLTGLALLAQLRVRPFSRDLQSASEKLLAALPEQMQKVLGQSERIIGFERTPRDIFHADTDGEAHSEPEALQLESQVITRFLEAIHASQAVNFVYQTRHRAAKARTHEPLGLFWDRERWYLVTQPLEQGQSSRIWRADRVLSLTAAHELEQPNSEFQIEQVLGRRWLRQAMRDWRQASPVRMRITPEQAQRLQEDWYYAHAEYEPQADGSVVMWYGEYIPSLAFALLRWLGPGAELLEPVAWRAAFADELRTMLASYEHAPKMA